jgi:hypothetical protein
MPSAHYLGIGDPLAGGQPGGDLDVGRQQLSHVRRGRCVSARVLSGAFASPDAVIRGEPRKHIPREQAVGELLAYAVCIPNPGTAPLHARSGCRFPGG